MKNYVYSLSINKINIHFLQIHSDFLIFYYFKFSILDFDIYDIYHL